MELNLYPTIVREIEEELQRFRRHKDKEERRVLQYFSGKTIELTTEAEWDLLLPDLKYEIGRNRKGMKWSNCTKEFNAAS